MSGLTPPVPVPEGQLVAWVFPTSVITYNGDSGASSGGVNGSGGYCSVVLSYGGVFTQPTYATFSDFVVNLLPGTPIHSAYAVANISYSGYSAEGGPNAPAPGFNTPNSTSWGGSYNYAIDPASIESYSVHFQLYYTLVPPGPGIFVNPLVPPLTYTVTGLAIAVYYTPLPGFLPSFALIGTYDSSGDTSVPATATAVVVPSSTTPNTPVYIFWTSTNIIQVEISGNNEVDPAFDVVISTPNTSGSYQFTTGFSVTTDVLFQAYDSLTHVAVSQTITVAII